MIAAMLGSDFLIHRGVSMLGSCMSNHSLSSFLSWRFCWAQTAFYLVLEAVSYSKEINMPFEKLSTLHDIVAGAVLQIFYY